MVAHLIPRLVATAMTLFCTGHVFAGAQEYFCTVTQDLEVQEDGTTARRKVGSLAGRTLAVSRTTGQVITPYSAALMSSRMQFKVLAPGNNQNSFVAMGMEPAGGEGMFTLLLTVQEFSESLRKPFLLTAGARVLAGTCE